MKDSITSQWSLIMVVLSIIFGSLGLTNILSLLGPILDGIYPPAIVLVLYYALCPSAMSPRQTLAARWAMYASVIFGALDMIWKYFVKLDANPGGICDLYLKLPFADVSLGLGALYHPGFHHWLVCLPGKTDGSPSEKRSGRIN